MSFGNRKNQHSFAQIPDVHIGRSKFNRSSALKDTMQFDYLNPIFVDEVLPGDTFNLTVLSFMRLATQLKPIMDNMYVDFFFFFVPNRLVFDKWEAMNGQQENPGDSTDYILPQMPFPAGGPEIGSIFDKFGLPTDVAAAWTLKNSLPFRGHNKIYNDWFRDQNLQNSLPVPKDEGPDSPSDFALQKRGKRHDYFTSALPWPQKGPAVDLPLGNSAPVFANSGLRVDGLPDVAPTFKNLAGGTSNVKQIISQNGQYGAFWSSMGDTGGDMAQQWDNPRLSVTQDQINNPMGMGPVFSADLSEATAATINALRQAFQMQSLFELDARGGTRYVEVLKSHFGVISPDFRLQRAEYLGGGSTKINSHPVAQSAPGTDVTESPQANLASFATASTTSRDGIGFTKSFVEHGYVFGYCAARADITYQQGLNRMWWRSTRYDFFWPKLQELGEQVVFKGELFTNGTTDTDPFGYQERYAEYRYKPSEIHGKFKSSDPQSLDFWHMAQEFAGPPSLNAAFIESSTPIERAIAVPSEPHLLADFFFQLTCARPMLTYSVPASLGRF